MFAQALHTIFSLIESTPQAAGTVLPPYPMVAAISPRRLTQRSQVLRRILTQIRSAGHQARLTASRQLAEQLVHPLRTFEPPVTKQFSIKSRNHDSSLAGLLPM